MRKIILLPLFFVAFGYMASAQTNDKIEKALKDPATQERSEKADALLINRQKIVPDEKSAKQLQPATTKKNRHCTKSSN